MRDIERGATAILQRIQAIQEAQAIENRRPDRSEFSPSENRWTQLDACNLSRHVFIQAVRKLKLDGSPGTRSAIHLPTVFRWESY